MVSSMGKDKYPVGASMPPEAARRYAALDALACQLVWELEMIDPSGHFEMERGPKENWLALPENEREVYLTALQRVLRHRELVAAVLSQRMPKDNRVDGR
jgi:hypothetical protein